MIKKYMFYIILTISILCYFYCEGQQRNNSKRFTKNHQKDHKYQGKGQHPYQNRKHNRKGQDVKQETNNHDSHLITLTGEEKRQIQIKTITVNENPVQSTLKAMGKVLATPDGKAIVGYGFPGRIFKLHVGIGQWVKKGDALVTLRCEEVGNAKSEYLKAYTECQLAEENYKREERLFKKEIGAKKDFLAIKAQMKIAYSTLAAIEKKLQVMGFSKEKIESFSQGKNISPDVIVHAPISGKIVQNNAVLGAMIEPDNEILIILNPSTLCIDAEIYEKDLDKIRPQQEVQISVPAYPTKNFIGQICYIGDIVHPETRTITVRTKVSNPEFKLKSGMFADIKILLGQKDKAVTVPHEAVLANLDKKIVFVQEGDSFLCKNVVVGASFNGYVEIKKGIEIGEIVVVQGNYQLKSKLFEEELHHGHVH